MPSLKAPTDERPLDMICIGRAMADLYSDQIGGRLEDAVTFSVYVGGSAANICVGAARLGLGTAMLVRVGDDHMGRLVRETMALNGVNTDHVITDPSHPTPLVVLGVRDQTTFPRDLFTHDCAYLQLKREDFDEALFASARSVLINGTFFATPDLAAVSRAALEMGKAAGCTLVLDIDYRPALWGLVSHGAGETAYIESAAVSATLQEFVPLFDLIVGTEEEIQIAGGSPDTLASVRRLRELGDATIIVKRGILGCVAFPGAIPDDIETGLIVPTFPVDVMNTAGAGDSYMAGLMRGWLRGHTLEESCRIGNVCGAMNVARHGCSDSAPTWPEVEIFLEKRGIRTVGRDAGMNHLHRATTRRNVPAATTALDLARVPALEAAAARAGGAEALARFVSAAATVALERGFDGLMWSDRFDRGDLARLTGRGLWLSRDFVLPAQPGTPSFGAGVAAMDTLRSWPRDQVVRVVVPAAWHDALPALADALTGLVSASAITRHEILIDVAALDEGAGLVAALYERGVRPDWWGVSPTADAAALADVIARHDPLARGWLTIHPSGPLPPAGRAAGRALSGDALLPVAVAWLSGRIEDGDLPKAVATALA